MTSIITRTEHEWHPGALAFIDPTVNDGFVMLWETNNDITYAHLSSCEVRTSELLLVTAVHHTVQHGAHETMIHVVASHGGMGWTYAAFLLPMTMHYVLALHAKNRIH